MRTLLTIMALVGVLVSFAVPVSAATAPLPGQPAAGGSTMTYEHVVSVLNSLVTTVLEIAGFIVVAVIVYYGVRMATAGSNDTVYGEARKGLNWAIVGALVIFGAYTIIATVSGLVDTVSSGTSQ